MSIATKVRETGEFFHATGIIAEGGIEHIAPPPLEQDGHYVGTHYPGSVVNGNRVHYTSFDQSVEFDGKDLEEMQGDVKLIPPKRPGEDDLAMAKAEFDRSYREARAQANRERQASLGITHAIWLYSNAPCMKDPRHPTGEGIQEDAAHRAANGKRYEISKGLFVDGKWTWPGVEEGCKCSSRSVLPF